MKKTKYEFHPLANVFPIMPDSELGALADDIKANGLLEPIWLHPDGQIIDGRNRYLACQRAGVEPAFKTWSGKGSLLDFILSLNSMRRHQSTSQKAMTAARIANYSHGGQRTKSPIEPLISIEQIAKRLGIGRESVKRARRVISDGISELIELVDGGEIAVSVAIEIAYLPKDKQKEIAGKGIDTIKSESSRLSLQRQAKIKIDPELSTILPPLRDGEFWGLEQNLLKYGCMDSLIVWEETNILLDGHARLEICQRHGIKYKVAYKSLPDRNAAIEWIINNQLGRGNLSTYARAELILKVAELTENNPDPESQKELEDMKTAFEMDHGKMETVLDKEARKKVNREMSKTPKQEI